jgi:predicted  nucleic acid-binding Zn-ribbon protein
MEMKSGIDFDKFVFKIGQNAGTGFLMLDRYVLTCAHVVGLPLTLGKEIKVKQFDRDAVCFEECNAKLVWFPSDMVWLPSDESPDKQSDIAILKIEDLLHDNPRKLTANSFLRDELINRVISDRKMVVSRGFPTKDGPQREFTMEGYIDSGIAVMKPNDWKHTSGSKIKGFSGAPVWYSTESINGLMGMLVAGTPAKDLIEADPSAHVILAYTLINKGILDFIYKDSLSDLIDKNLPLSENIFADICRIFQGLLPGTSFKDELDNPSSINIKNLLEKITLAEGSKQQKIAKLKESEDRIFQFSAILYWLICDKCEVSVFLKKWIDDCCENSQIVLKESEKIVLLYRSVMNSNNNLEREIATIREELKKLAGSEQKLLDFDQKFSNKIDRGFLEVGKKFSDIDQKFSNKINQRIDKINQQIDEFDREFSEVNQRISELDQKFSDDFCQRFSNIEKIQGQHQDDVKNNFQSLEKSNSQSLEKNLHTLTERLIVGCFFVLILVSNSTIGFVFSYWLKPSQTPITTSSNSTVSTTEVIPSEPSEKKESEALGISKKAVAGPNPISLSTPSIVPSSSTENIKSKNPAEEDWEKRGRKAEAKCGTNYVKSNDKGRYPVFLTSLPGKFDNDFIVVKTVFCGDAQISKSYPDTIQVATFVGRENAEIFEHFLGKYKAERKSIEIGKREVNPL